MEAERGGRASGGAGECRIDYGGKAKERGDAMREGGEVEAMGGSRGERSGVMQSRRWWAHLCTQGSRR